MDNGRIRTNKLLVSTISTYVDNRFANQPLFERILNDKYVQTVEQK